MSMYGTQGRSSGKRLKESRYKQADLVSDCMISGSIAQRYRKVALRSTVSNGDFEVSQTTTSPITSPTPTIISTKDWLAQQKFNKNYPPNLASMPASSVGPGSAVIATDAGKSSTLAGSERNAKSRLARGDSNPELTDVGEVGSTGYRADWVLQRETEESSGYSISYGDKAKLITQTRQVSAKADASSSLISSRQRYRSENDLLSAAANRQQMHLVAIDDVHASSDIKSLGPEESFVDRLEAAIIHAPRIIAMPRGKDGFGFSVDAIECESIRIPRFVRVQTGSFAHLAGIQVGDFIVEINGEKVIGDIADNCASVLDRSGDVVKMIVVTVNDPIQTYKAGTRNSSATGTRASDVSDGATTVGGRMTTGLQKSLLNLDIQRHQTSSDVAVATTTTDAHSVSSSLDDTGSTLLDTPTSGYGSALEVGFDDSSGLGQPLTTSPPLLDRDDRRRPTDMQVRSCSDGVKVTSGVKALQSTLNLNFVSVGVPRTQRFDGGNCSTRNTIDGGIDDTYEKLPFRKSNSAVDLPSPSPPPLRSSTGKNVSDHTGGSSGAEVQASTESAAIENNSMRSTTDDSEDFLKRAETLRRNYVRKSQLYSVELDDVFLSKTVDTVDVEDTGTSAAAFTGSGVIADLRPSLAPNESAHIQIAQLRVRPNSVTQDVATANVKMTFDAKPKSSAPFKPGMNRRTSGEIDSRVTETNQSSMTVSSNVTTAQVPQSKTKVPVKPPPPRRTISCLVIDGNLPDHPLRSDNTVDDNHNDLPPPPSDFFEDEAFRSPTDTTANVIKSASRPKVAPKVGIRRPSSENVIGLSTRNSNPKSNVPSDSLDINRVTSGPVLPRENSQGGFSATTGRSFPVAGGRSEVLVAVTHSPSLRTADQFVPPPPLFDNDLTAETIDKAPPVLNSDKWRPPATSTLNRRPPPVASKPKPFSPKDSPAVTSSTSVFNFTDVVVGPSTSSVVEGNVHNEMMFAPLPPPVAYTDDIDEHNRKTDSRHPRPPKSLPTSGTTAALPHAVVVPLRAPTVKSVSDWSVEDVGSWLDRTLLGQHRERFRLGCIDGQRLASLDRSKLIDLGVVEVVERMSIERKLRKLLSSQ